MVLAALAGAAFILWPRPSQTRQPGDAPVNEPHARPVVEFNGVASCSSMACHHFNGVKGAARSEYSTWAGDEKHSRAFTVLYNDRSARIVRNLRGSSAVAATEDELCLKCHATNDGRTHNVGDRFALADGVGCESCHGPSQKYLTAHFQHGFKELSDTEKASRYGLWPTKDLTFRTKLCTTCHVGDSSKEVNHDLIAAGHPRLNFEMAGYHGIYNKHWTDDAERSRHPDFYARIWLLGQLVSAKSAVDLLAARAEGSLVPPEKVGKPWPEFAEYACYACHKDLEVNSARQRAGYADRHPGSLLYGTWYLTALTPLSGANNFAPKELDDTIGSLKRVMQKPGPDAAASAADAKKISASLDKLIDATEKAKPLDAAQVKTFLKKYVADGLRPTGRPVIVEQKTATEEAKTRPGVRIDEMDWDEATQLYLSMAALSQALSDAGSDAPAAIRGDLLAIKGRLKTAFPSGFDSPRDYNPLEEPKKGIRSLKEHLEAIQKLLGN